MSVDELFLAANSLPATERMLLSDLLRDTVPPEAWPELSEEWKFEVASRSEAYDAGKMSLTTWPKVRDRASRRAGLNA